MGIIVTNSTAPGELVYVTSPPHTQTRGSLCHSRAHRSETPRPPRIPHQHQHSSGSTPLPGPPRFHHLATLLPGAQSHLSATTITTAPEAASASRPHPAHLYRDRKALSAKPHPLPPHEACNLRERHEMSLRPWEGDLGAQVRCRER
jgi:hypothetical protein